MDTIVTLGPVVLSQVAVFGVVALLCLAATTYKLRKLPALDPAALVIGSIIFLWYAHQEASLVLAAILLFAATSSAFIGAALGYWNMHKARWIIMMEACAKEEGHRQ